MKNHHRIKRRTISWKKSIRKSLAKILGDAIRRRNSSVNQLTRTLPLVTLMYQKLLTILRRWICLAKAPLGEITNCTSSELSHETEVIEDIANSAVNSNINND